MLQKSHSGQTEIVSAAARCAANASFGGHALVVVFQKKCALWRRIQADRWDVLPGISRIFSIARRKDVCRKCIQSRATEVFLPVPNTLRKKKKFRTSRFTA